MNLKSALGGGGWAVALIVGVAALVGGDKADLIDNEPQIIIAPASGIFGFDVGPFCNDSATKVVALPAPDALAGVTWQLTRLRDGRFETVVVPGNFLTGIHYYDDLAGQQSEPATVDNSARDCIIKKGK